MMMIHSHHPFGSSEVENPYARVRCIQRGFSTSLETNGVRGAGDVLPC